MKKFTTLFLALTLIFGVVSACIWVVDADPQNYEGVSVGFSVVINHADGTNETYTPSPLSLLPYSVSGPSGKDFETLGIYLNAKMETSGIVESWAFTGTQQLEFYYTPAGGLSDAVSEESSTIDISDSGSAWADGETKTLSYVSLHHSQIESVCEQYGTGDWSININAEVTVDVTFESGASDIAEAIAPAMAMPFTYSNDGINDFSLEIQNSMTPLSLGQNLLAGVGLPLWTLHALFPVLTAICLVATFVCYKIEPEG